jgi:hypothetical protein
MTASSRRGVGADSRMRFSTPVLVSVIAVVAMAIVAIAFIVFSGGGPRPRLPRKRPQTVVLMMSALVRESRLERLRQVGSTPVTQGAAISYGSTIGRRASVRQGRRSLIADAERPQRRLPHCRSCRRSGAPRSSVVACGNRCPGMTETERPAGHGAAGVSAGRSATGGCAMGAVPSGDDIRVRSPLVTPTCRLSPSNRTDGPSPPGRLALPSAVVAR